MVLFYNEYINCKLTKTAFRSLYSLGIFIIFLEVTGLQEPSGQSKFSVKHCNSPPLKLSHCCICCNDIYLP